MWADLQKHIDADDTENILRSCDAILRESPEDADALHVRCVALLELSRFEEALQAAHKVPEDACQFEAAYALYRLGRHEESLAAARRHPQEDRCRALIAQNRYKMGDFRGAAEASAAAGEDVDVESLTNRSAALLLANDAPAALALYEEHKGDAEVQESSEFIFNAACAALELGRLRVAAALLDSAEFAARETLEQDNASEKHITDELAAIQVQRAYVHQLLGEVAAASDAYAEVLRSKPSDQSAAAVAANNLASCKPDAGFFDSIKKVERYDNPAVAAKMGDRQNKALLWTHCLLLFHTHRLAKCQEKLGEFEQRYPSSGLPVILRAAILQADKKSDEAIALLQGSSSFEAAAALAEVQSRTDPRAAAATLTSSDELRSSLGAVSSAVALYLKADDKEAAVGAIDAALDLVKSPADKEQLLLLAAKLHAELGAHEQAAASYKRVLDEVNKDNVRALVGFVMAASEYNVEEAEKVVDRLPLVASAADVDVEQLVRDVRDAAPAASVAPAVLPAVANAGAGEQTASRKRHKKHRKKKKPPPKDTSKPIDPERWLPMHERSYYVAPRGKGKKKGGKGGAKQSYGHQGAVGGGGKNDALDAAAKRKEADRKEAERRAAEKEARRQETTRQQQAARNKKKNTNRKKKKKK